jgi:hypothetical protein
MTFVQVEEYALALLLLVFCPIVLPRDDRLNAYVNQRGAAHWFFVAWVVWAAAASAWVNERRGDNSWSNFSPPSSYGKLGGVSLEPDPAPTASREDGLFGVRTKVFLTEPRVENAQLRVRGGAMEGNVVWALRPTGKETPVVPPLTRVVTLQIRSGTTPVVTCLNLQLKNKKMLGLALPGWIWPTDYCVRQVFQPHIAYSDIVPVLEFDKVSDELLKREKSEDCAYEAKNK